jgi:hypothetical protein
MESCHKLTLEDSRGRVPLPRFGGHGRERPADGAAAETFDSVEGTLPDPQRWGLSSEAIGTLGERLYECWRRFAMVSRPARATRAATLTTICEGS